MGQPVVHFEIIGNEPQKLRSFYSELFGWKLGDMMAPEMGSYSMIDGESAGIPGGIAVDGIIGIAVVQLSDVSEPALPVGARLILDISLGISSDHSVRDIFGTLPERLDFLRLEHVLYDQKPVSVKLINQRLAERHVPLSLILFRGLVI